MRILFYIIASVFSIGLFAQSPSYYNYSDTKLRLNSVSLQDSIVCHFHLPETFNSAAANTKYPVIILFDSQHEKTYPQIINALDMLTSESQVPESIIIGIPFDRYNRYYYTSSQTKKGDSIAGIERTEAFIFQELLPLLKEKYQANDFLALVGHSRTAFLTNYLLTKQSPLINLAIAASGFYNNKPLQVEGMKAFLSDSESFPHQSKYFFTAGTTIDEKIYFDQCTDMADFLEKENHAKNLEWSFTATESANHMTNYWMSVPPIFAQCFSSYNKILNDWFETKLKDQQLQNPVASFKADLTRVGNELGFKVNPSLTQLFSIASDYAQKERYETAIDFILLGKEYYPDYAELDESLVEFYKALGDLGKSHYWQKQMEQRTNEPEGK